MLGVLASGHFGSPGHLNPAVTIGFAVAGSFEWGQVAPFILVSGLLVLLSGRRLQRSTSGRIFKIQRLKKGAALGFLLLDQQFQTQH